ncbi:hypothetical protein MHYP_G00175170 [Metynnis hypsauchen]
MNQRTGKARERRRRLMEKRGYKPPLPSLIMGNVRSLVNKMDELTVLARSQREYRECSLMCFSETWLHQDIPDDNVSIDGFQTIRADRGCTESGKRKGGGLAVLVNNRWCNPGHITIKERACCPDIELLAVGLRPYYLPREYSYAIIVTVYVPPSANPTSACDVIHSIIARLQTQHPSAFMAISGDFNHVTMAKTLPNFIQYVDCPTREERTLDLLYANVKDAYRCSPLPPLGRSDHNLVNLSPCYVPLVKSQPVTTRTVSRWSEETYEALQDCFEATDWTAFCEPHGEDIDGLTECITDYINFCVDSTVPTRIVKCYPNNKPWVTKDIKALLNEKKRAFRAGDRVEPAPPRDSPSHTSIPSLPGTSTVSLTVDQVRRQLQRLHTNKAAGPDGVHPRVLKACASQLCGVLQHVFNKSLSLQRVPMMWKMSCIAPVPKTPRPSRAKDYRPVALTSHVMKTMERLVLDQLRPIVQPFLDPLQFAYQPRLGVEDAVIYLLNRVYVHLDKPASTVRVMFFDFSSAFNTIWPALLGEKLTVMQVDAPLVSWIVDYLTGRPQYVRLQHCVSDRVVSNTGVPQGTVLSPFLFTLYTTDFSYCTETCHLQKFF